MTVEGKRKEGKRGRDEMMNSLLNEKEKGATVLFAYIFQGGSLGGSCIIAYLMYSVYNTVIIT